MEGLDDKGRSQTLQEGVPALREAVARTVGQVRESRRRWELCEVQRPVGCSKGFVQFFSTAS